jgi:hypothetical protein
MTPTRLSAAAVLAVALVAATVIDQPRLTARAPVRGNILELDSHVHAFPGDGSLPRWELQREAARRGLDAIVITNHNQTLAGRFGALLRGSDVLVIPGEEVTTPAFHLIAAGVRQTIDWRLPLREMVAEIHRQGGVAIAAHPGDMSWLPRDPDLLRTLDGAETAHAMMHVVDGARAEIAAFFAEANGAKPAIAPIGASDTHATPGLGACRTYVFVDERSERGVLTAIREGRTVASDGRGTLTGDPERVRQVRAHIASTPPSPVRNAPRLLATAVLLCLAFLLLLNKKGRLEHAQPAHNRKADSC